jgi:hypothetical protein
MGPLAAPTTSRAPYVEKKNDCTFKKGEGLENKRERKRQ